jgi:two-component system, NarL family, sensor histidine kinase DevS
VGFDPRTLLPEQPEPLPPAEHAESPVIAPLELDADVLVAMIDAAPDGLVMTDERGRIVWANDRTAELFGYQPEELVGQVVEVLLPTDRRAAHRSDRERYNAEPRTRAMGEGLELHGLRRDGSEFAVEISLSPLRRSGSLHVIAAIRDITDRLRIEHAVRESEDALQSARAALAITEDRERIARDLHDTVIQRLFAAGMALQATLGQIDDDAARARLEQTVDDLDETIREIRTAIFGLHAPADGGPGLRGDIVRITNGARASLGFTPRVHFSGAVESIPPDIAEQLLPALRETLANTAKHAQATSARVSIDVGNEVVLRVADNGVGITGEVTGGHGLTNLGDRAARLGGRFTARPGPDGGTEMEWRVPIVPPGTAGEPPATPDDLAEAT